MAPGQTQGGVRGGGGGGGVMGGEGVGGNWWSHSYFWQRSSVLPADKVLEFFVSFSLDASLMAYLPQKEKITK